MKDPTLKQLDKDREDGFRPGVVCCCVHDKKILLLYKEEYGLWLLPQGGIQNEEEPKDAIKRDLKEEMGEEFLKKCKDDYTAFGEDKIEFSESKRGMNELKTDEGFEVFMLGKKYYFYVVNVTDSEFDISKTVFDQHFWLDYDKARFLAERIYQRRKSEMIVNILDLLKEGDVIS